MSFFVSVAAVVRALREEEEEEEEEEDRIRRKEMATCRESGGLVAVRCAGRIGVVASVAMNLAWIAMYIRRRYFGAGGGGSDNNGRGVTTVEPSKGKPPVTEDSIVNLDQ